MENKPGLTWNRQMLEWIREAVHYRNSIPEGEADPKKTEELVKK